MIEAGRGTHDSRARDSRAGARRGWGIHCIAAGLAAVVMKSAGATALVAGLTTNLAVFDITVKPARPVGGEPIKVTVRFGVAGGVDVVSNPFTVDIYVDPSFDTRRAPPADRPGDKTLIYVWNNREGPPPTVKTVSFESKAHCGKMVFVGAVNRTRSLAETDYRDNWRVRTVEVECPAGRIGPRGPWRPRIPGRVPGRDGTPPRPDIPLPETPN